MIFSARHAIKAVALPGQQAFSNVVIDSSFEMKKVTLDT
jgi:hypothetical protein